MKQKQKQNDVVRLSYAKGQLISAVNNLVMTFDLSPIETEGLLSSVLTQVQDQTKLELMGEIIKLQEAKSKEVKEESDG